METPGISGWGLLIVTLEFPSMILGGLISRLKTRRLSHFHWRKILVSTTSVLWLQILVENLSMIPWSLLSGSLQFPGLSTMSSRLTLLWFPRISGNILLTGNLNCWKILLVSLVTLTRARSQFWKWLKPHRAMSGLGGPMILCRDNPAPRQVLSNDLTSVV